MSIPEYLNHEGNDVIADEWSHDNRRITQRKHDTRLGHDWQKFGRTRRCMAKAAILGSLATIPFGLYMRYDVTPEAVRLSHTQPQVHEVYEALDPINDDTAVIDMVGLGNVNATETATSLVSYRELGKVWAVQYDNAGLDTKVIADMVVEKAETENIDRVILSGHSMGGIVSLEVASHVQKETDIDVIGVVLDCTPDDLDAVRPDAQSKALEMMRLIGKLPGARESRTLRFALEVGSREAQFLDGDWWNPTSDFDAAKFRKVVDQVMTTKILSHDVASNRLIETQVQAIAASGVHDNIKTLGEEVDDKPIPKIVFMYPMKTANDRVVDVVRARGNINESAHENGIDFTAVAMEGTGHANPNQEPERYNDAISRYVVGLFVRTQTTIAHTSHELAQAVPPEK